ncbi:beta-galactosidase-1-like protein 3 [Camelus bactrianus]|uniref:Beta-galactosidase-1-like protein 3 n=1 Tax=Camelus bactrianus TaxID=9837 RepID=A0AC58PTI4_CAMBA
MQGSASLTVQSLPLCLGLWIPAQRTPESAALGSGQQRGDGSSVGRGLLGLAVMGPPPRFSPHLAWRRILCIFFLPFISSGFAPRIKYTDKFIFGKEPLTSSKPRASTVPFFPAVRFNWSHLTPLELKDRSVGLQAEEGVGRNPYFTLEGHEFLIFGGSIHYFRVPREYWRDRLLKLRACGFNTVTTYVPWNLHEPESGKFDFSGNLDLEAFVLLAAEVGLWVILRPGPYVCSELDLGGLPSRLLQDPTTQLRTTNRTFVEAVDKYFDHLIARVVPLQYHKGGPIIAVQVENEYGSFNKDKNYMPYLHKALLERGVVELLLTSDNTNKVLNGHIKGVLATINMNSFRADTFEQLFKVQKNKPILIMEYWVGWFDTWGKRHTPTDAGDVENTVTEFIQLDISFNVYMFHGGTNFGFMNGGIHFTHYRAVITSYDYDAVLTEAGDYTDKYFKLRKLFQSVFVTPLPLLPKPTHKAVYPSMRLSLYLPLWDVLQYLNRPVVSRTPLNMENLPIHGGNGQAFGLVLYEATICSGGRLHVEARDAAQVFLNETSLGILADETQNVDVPTITECQLLRILVENQGRVNFSWKIQDQRKGIIGSVTINSVPLENFTIYSLEMRTSFFRRLRTAIWRPVSDDHLGPAFYLGTLKAGSSPRDTFLALPSWKYGFVFINGRNLGRYWNIGPQGTLYLPGAWLNPGNNEIILFEKRKSGSYIYSTDKPVL